LDQDLEARVRDRAYVLWEQHGRPEGQELAHWHEAERQVMAESGEDWQPEGPDDAAVTGDLIPADPLRNPEPVAPQDDLDYPAVTGPESASPGASGGAADGAPKRKQRSLRKRPGNSTLEP
jgi:hypothetical protein